MSQSDNEHLYSKFARRDILSGYIYVTLKMSCHVLPNYYFFVKVLPNYWKELFASNLDIIQVVNFQALTKFWALPKEMDVPNSKYELSFNIINYNALRKKKDWPFVGTWEYTVFSIFPFRSTRWRSHSKRVERKYF